ncbi:MAG: VOC family protein [Saprospiraceae bacterium]|nr:VOC family protein [Candidatus Vicinibacter affinis]MBK7696375.1 VOC family protein [Candidatus Vicinibacter affinis]
MSIIKITGIDHIKMEVNNVQETVDFYSKLFGFKILEGTPSHPCIIGNDAVKLCIHQGESSIWHFGFHVENYEEIKPICGEHHAQLGMEAHWAHSDSEYVIDPCGREVELSRVWGGGLSLRADDNQ